MDYTDLSEADLDSWATLRPTGNTPREDWRH